MINNLKTKIENFIETKNGMIQMIVLFVTLLLGAMYKLGVASEMAIIIDLLAVIVFEMIVANIKDSILQRKLNRLGVRIETEDGKLFRISDFNLKSMFENTKKDFFVSGLALNRFMDSYKTKLLELLGEDKVVRFLIMDPKKIEDAALLYFGEKSHRAQKEIITRQKQTIMGITNDGKLKDWLEKGRLEFGVQDIVFSTSFIAHDVFCNKSVKREVKASFYQFGCRDPEREPNILINSEDSNDWYNLFLSTIKLHWETSRKIASIEELDNLFHELEEMEKNLS